MAMQGSGISGMDVGSATLKVNDEGFYTCLLYTSVLAIILSFSPKFEAVINTIPSGIVGGISFVLYGMISAIGVRNVVENKVDFTNSRNLIIAAVILVSALGFNSVGGISFGLGNVTINPVSYTHLDVYKRQIPDCITDEKSVAVGYFCMS